MSDLDKLREVMDNITKSIGPWTDCPHCGADKKHQEVRNYDPMWHDGDVYCAVCNNYVRGWDAG